MRVGEDALEGISFSNLPCCIDDIGNLRHECNDICRLHGSKRIA
jgi:hypothetical protein